MGVGNKFFCSTQFVPTSDKGVQSRLIKVFFDSRTPLLPMVARVCMEKPLKCALSVQTAKAKFSFDIQGRIMTGEDDADITNSERLGAGH